MRKIKSIEIELPYRYRGYEVGKPIMYDVQNNSYVGEDYSNAVKIKKIVVDDFLVCGQPERNLYQIFLTNGDYIEIMDNQPGLIVTWEAQDERN